jgi:hypothetical protein
MNIDNYKVKEVTDFEGVEKYLGSIETEKAELILTSSGKTVGAILTSQQYDWFLDQLDAQQDTNSISERVGDREGSIGSESLILRAKPSNQ